ncbi:MAG: biotin/lipoyl-binding protein [Anaerolineae bacterium]|jgi:biotin carboxyl carrier protein
MTAVSGKVAGQFTITLDGVEYPVVVESGSKPPWKLTVNGRSFTVAPEEGGKVLVDGIAYELRLEGDTVRAGDVSHEVEVSGLALGQTSRGGLPSAAPAPKARGGAGAVVAIMPGQVTRVLIEEGQEVKDGQAVCVLEAMKMENELRADRSGIVKAVHVQPGDDVEKDQVLLEIG